MSDPLLALVEALAEQDARDYLRELAGNDAASGEARPQPVPLPDMDKAA